jgi:hypothetical protein
MLNAGREDPIMVAVVVERDFKSPTSAAGLQDTVASGQWCLNLYRIRPSAHFLSADGMRCACIFDAPDAEAMRSAVRNMTTSAPKRLWPATVHLAPGSRNTIPALVKGDRTFVVVERSFPQAVIFDDLQAIEDKGAACLDLYKVRFERSYFSHDRQRMICIYEAPDSESVRAANTQVGMPFDAVWSASVIVASTRASW